LKTKYHGVFAAKMIDDDERQRDHRRRDDGSATAAFRGRRSDYLFHVYDLFLGRITRAEAGF
jgi:hypothetical protein